MPGHYLKKALLFQLIVPLVFGQQFRQDNMQHPYDRSKEQGGHDGQPNPPFQPFEHHSPNQQPYHGPEHPPPNQQPHHGRERPPPNQQPPNQQPHHGPERPPPNQQPYHGPENPPPNQQPHHGPERPPPNQQPYHGPENPPPNQQPFHGQERHPPNQPPFHNPEHPPPYLNFPGPEHGLGHNLHVHNPHHEIGNHLPNPEDDIPSGRDIQTNLSPELQERVLEKVNDLVPEIADAIIHHEMVLDGLEVSDIDADTANATFKSLPSLTVLSLTSMIQFIILRLR